MENGRQCLQCILGCSGDGHVENDTLIPGKTRPSAREQRRSRHRSDDSEITGFAFANVAVDMGPNCRHLGALLEILWVVERVVADVLGCSTAKE